MREVTVTTKVYGFDELSDEARESAVQELVCINVDCEWWDSTLEDAKTIGLVIRHFILGQASHVCGSWVEEAEEVAALILENHGDVCETHKDATAFLADLEDAQEAHRTQPGWNAHYDDDFEDTDAYEELCQEFKATICEDYRIILQAEEDYLCSEEAIIETIKANEYEFTADGTLYC